MTASLVATGGLWASRCTLHFTVPEFAASSNGAGRLSHALASGPIGMWPLMAAPAPPEACAGPNQPIVGSEGITKPCLAATITAAFLGAARRGTRHGRGRGHLAANARRTGQWWRDPGIWWQGLVEARDGAPAAATNAVEAMSAAPGNVATASQRAAAEADMAGATVRAMRGSRAVWEPPHNALEAARGAAEAPSHAAVEPQKGTVTAIDTVRGWFAAAGSAFAALGQLGAKLSSVGPGQQREPRVVPVAVACSQGKMGTTVATGARTPKERSPRDRAVAALRAAISVAEDAGVDLAQLETAWAVAGMPAAASSQAAASQQDEEAARARARAIARSRIELAVAEEAVQRAAREEAAGQEATAAQRQTRGDRVEPPLPRVLRVQAQPLRAMVPIAAAAKKPAAAPTQGKAGGVQELLMQHASAQDAARDIAWRDEQQRPAEAAGDVAQEGARERYLRAKAVFQA